MVEFFRLNLQPTSRVILSACAKASADHNYKNKVLFMKNTPYSRGIWYIFKILLVTNYPLFEQSKLRS